MLRVTSLALIAVALLGCPNREVSASATKPLSPAEGAKDYDQTPGGPLQKPPVPSPSGEVPTEKSEIAECPPKCAENGGWIGCGLKKTRGSKCQGCTPKCKSKGGPDEGWYDCSGLLIVQRSCS